MIRRVNRYKDKQRVYYICSTKNRGEGCTRHSIAEKKLKELTDETIRRYANYFLEEKHVSEKSRKQKTDLESVVCYDAEIARLKKEQDKYYSLCSGLYEDLKQGIITEEEFKRLYGEFKRRAEAFEEAQEKQEAMIKELLKKSVVSVRQLKMMQDCPELKEIDRYTLCSMVKEIIVYENQRIEMVFYYTDRYRVVGEADKKINDSEKRLH